MDFNQEKDDYIAQDVPENDILNHHSVNASPTTSVLIKTEALYAQNNVLDSLKLPVVKEEAYEDPHVDHSYINDTSLKFNQMLSPKVSHPSSTLQEIKVRPQFIKEETSTEEEVRVKTETNTAIKTTKFKCVTCNLPFRNKYIYKSHREICHPRVVYPLNLVKQNSVKYRPQNAIILRKLIECVKNNPCLYNIDHENHTNEDLKSVIWSNIASECNFPNGTIASGEWKSLKNQFVRAITHRNSGSKRHWMHEKQMEFLMPYLTDEDVHVNIRKEKTDAAVTVTESGNNVEEVIEDETPVQQHTPRLKRMSVSSTQQENYPKRKCEEQRPGTSQSQPLDMFFLSMCATTKNLPEYVQLQVKKKIFQAVIEAEEIVAAMHNDQEKNNLMNNEYENNMSPFSVHSNVNEVWEDD